MTNLLQTASTECKRLYNYLFTYDPKRLSTYSQPKQRILVLLTKALLHKQPVLLTYPNGHSEIGYVTKRISAGRFLFLTHQQQLLRLLDLEDIFRLDL
ncbi:MAG: hypothetical protein LKF01_05730 [Lactobacillus sp.]|nr:hypothetical protein [Lactobacillus sp.]MCH3906108.1 hypothetical protein [Lactobacillus sp.]MCH3990314.1 hypothetical protein [Lactobacillus sp.]MCH4068971.1 hypothetical protein [Lactobacillus sp.]MCI1303373.1 hypothetical protein [Lactobacillus sp.]